MSRSAGGCSTTSCRHVRFCPQAGAPGTRVCGPSPHTCLSASSVTADGRSLGSGLSIVLRSADRSTAGGAGAASPWQGGGGGNLVLERSACHPGPVPGSRFTPYSICGRSVLGARACSPTAPALCSGAQPDRGPGPPKKCPQRAMLCPAGSQVRGTRDPLPLRPTLSQEGTACVPRRAPSEQPEAMPPGSLARGAPKVADLDPAVGHHKEIVWLEVKVEELLRV